MNNDVSDDALAIPVLKANCNGCNRPIEKFGVDGKWHHADGLIYKHPAMPYSETVKPSTISAADQASISTATHSFTESECLTLLVAVRYYTHNADHMMKGDIGKDMDAMLEKLCEIIK